MNTFRATTLALVLALGAAACGSTDATGPATTGSGAPAPGADGKAPAGAAEGTAVEGLPLVVQLPAGVTPNAMGAGFHSEDGAYSLMIKDIIGDTNPKTMEEAKKATEEMFFKKWLKSEKTADGWVLTYVGVTLDMEGKEGEQFAYTVRRKIGSREYECYGGVKKQADLEKNMKLCQDLKSAE